MCQGVGDGICKAISNSFGLCLFWAGKIWLRNKKVGFWVGKNRLRSKNVGLGAGKLGFAVKK